MRRLRKAVTKSDEYGQATGNTTSKALALKHWPASEIATFASENKWDKVCVQAASKRLYFCAQMGANTASVTYREVFECSNPFTEISGPKNT